MVPSVSLCILGGDALMELESYLARQLEPLLGDDFLKVRPILHQACSRADADRDRRWTLFQNWRSLNASHSDLTRGNIEVGTSADLLATGSDETEWRAFLEAFHPWRKGPVTPFGVSIDTEWRSDWKWNRVEPLLPPLRGKRVVDVGTGNGYHLFRLLGQGAHTVIGVEPYWLFILQFLVLSLGQNKRVGMLPTTLEDLGTVSLRADVALSMGVLSHRQSPFEHLKMMRDQLVAGGTLILETLVVEGDDTTVFVPEGRYAQMRNVWFLPSAQALLGWCRRAGFRDVELCHEAVTSTQEQRATAWMRFQSLSDYLDPSDPDLTVEGHPRPRRAIIRALRPA